MNRIVRRENIDYISTMRTPWVNILLLFLVTLQGVTGYLGMVNNLESRAWIIWLHGIGAYGLVLILYFKAAIIFDTWRRKNRWTFHRIAFIGLLVFLIPTLISGLLWTFMGPIYLGGFSLISIHIYLAIPLMVLTFWHAWQLRFIRRVPGALGRRLFLGTGVISLFGFLIWGSTNQLKTWTGLNGSRRRFTGSYEVGSFMADFPTVSWIADRPPPVNLEHWELRIDGFIDHPKHFPYDELRNLPQTEITSVLDCTGGWYTIQRWRGVRVGDLLDLVRLRPEAQSITFEAFSGYKRRFDIIQAQEYILALGTLSGEEGDDFVPLSHGHGFPLRLVATDRRGLEWVKWVSVLRVNETSQAWQSPLPLQ